MLGTIPTTTFTFRGTELVIAVRDPQQVLQPTGVGLSLLNSIDDPKTLPISGRTVLDVGCGSGPYTVAALSEGAAGVTALDVNPACAAATAANVALNGLPADRVRYVTSLLAGYRPTEPFDVVMANPPHFPDIAGLPASGLSTALVGGVDGRAVYDDLITAAPRLLAPGGVLVLAHSSLTDIPRTTAEMSKAGFVCTTAAITTLPIPFAGLEPFGDRILESLDQLRDLGRADFNDTGFTVHTLLFTREGDAR